MARKRVLVIGEDCWTINGLCAVLRDSDDFDPVPKTIRPTPNHIHQSLDFGLILVADPTDSVMGWILGCHRHRQANKLPLPRTIVLERSPEKFSRHLAEGLVPLRRDFGPCEIIAALRLAFAGYIPVEQRHMHRFHSSMSTVSDGSDRKLGTLTGREREVFDLLVYGMSNLELATALGVAESTVKTHIRALLRKLSLRDRVSVVIYAYERGVLADVNRLGH